jgi:hypothetical protein
MQAESTRPSAELPNGKILVKNLTNHPSPGGPRFEADPKTGRVTAVDPEKKSLGDIGTK